jgi:hypothetical protein
MIPMKRLFIILLILMMIFVITACERSTTHTNEIPPDIETTAKNEPTPDLTDLVLPTQDPNEDISSDGPLVTDSEQLYGTWILIKQVNTLDDGTKITNKYKAGEPNTFYYTFDQININISQNNSGFYYGEYTVENGIFTMQDNSANSRPIVYTEMRLKDGVLTALFTDRDLTMRMEWEKDE